MREWRVTMRPKGKGQSRVARVVAPTRGDANTWAMKQILHWKQDPTQWTASAKEITRA